MVTCMDMIFPRIVRQFRQVKQQVDQKFPLPEEGIGEKEASYSRWTIYNFPILIIMVGQQIGKHAYLQVQILKKIK